MKHEPIYEYLPNRGYLGMWTHGHDGSYEQCSEHIRAFMFQALWSMVIIKTFPSQFNYIFLQTGFRRLGRGRLIRLAARISKMLQVVRQLAGNIEETTRPLTARW